jgi:hypothetical protein
MGANRHYALHMFFRIIDAYRGEQVVPTELGFGVE